jgi:hypothetical protein
MEESDGVCSTQRPLGQTLRREPKTLPYQGARVTGFVFVLWLPGDVHIRPGHHWMCEFGDVGNVTSCEKQFNLSHHKWVDYRGTRFYKGDCALVIKLWLNRVEEDVSGLTFQEWTPDVDTSRPPVPMLVNSGELCAAGFNLTEVLPPALEAATRGGFRSGTTKS